MTDTIYVVGLLIGNQVKIVGWSTHPTGSGTPPGAAIIKLQHEMDEFNRDTAESRAAVGIVTEPFIPARICRFSANEKERSHTWLPVGRLKLTEVYENFKKEQGHV